MTWLFIRFYVGVVLVLLAAWLIYGWVLERRTAADRARVVAEAHGGGARLVAKELDNAGAERRAETVGKLRNEFQYGVEVMPVIALPAALQSQVANGEVAYWAEFDSVVAPMETSGRVAKLGPFPNPGVRHIERAFRGWMRLAAKRLDAVSAEQRESVLSNMRNEFDVGVVVANRQSFPAWQLQRFDNGEDVVLYRSDDIWFSAIPLSENNYLRFGPFPGFQEPERPAATTTLALVLLPAAFAIALLLRPMAQQLRRVENAAKAIASGDLSARVDERKVASAKHLAESFNNMAGRTETLVRTQRELLQAVSHELRTPLSRMRFAIDLIETAEDDSERRQRLDALDSSAEELDALVGELLSYVRMETAGPLRNPEYVDVKDALQMAIPKFAGLYPAIEFQVNEQARDPVVFADRGGFQRAIGNLVSNAGRFARRRVVVHTESTNGATTIDVDDDGPGIPLEDRDRVFEPFVRLDNNSSEKNRGVGLGLALVKRIVTRNGGTIEVLTSHTGGCRMRTTWPSVDQEASITADVRAKSELL